MSSRSRDPEKSTITAQHQPEFSEAQTKAIEGVRPDNPQASSRRYQPVRHRRSIKLDRVNPRDLASADVRFFCDDCSHYDATAHRCTMGYVPQHTRKEQLAIYNLTGMMAFCRFLEID